MKRKKKINRKKIVILGLALVVVVFAGIFVKNTFFSKKALPAAKVVDKLDKYGYVLEDNETKYYTDIFKKLKKTLSQEPVNEKEYAKEISQLFISDYFNLANKTSKNDVGGVQFVFADYQKDFTKKSMDTVYKYVENDLYGDRKQELPVVKSVDVVNLGTTSFEYNDKNDEKAYTLDLKVNYEKDLGYQQDVTLILVHTGDKLEIAKMS